ncbi:MAG: ATP-binding cassette domain-containing protein [Bacteroidetes bacterium]|nr:MAG: ATP-binding cassette domain-containing protein [Bacteroidota bacterium]
MIDVQHLHKTFTLDRKARKLEGKREALAVEDVSFSCQPGRIFSLLGPNGAGKTTTLRMIATILRPTQGSINVAGHDVAREPEKVRAQLGFLTGSTGLYHRLTPREVVRYFAKLYGMDPTRARQREDELFTLLGIHDFATKRIGTLSTGMKQKVSIARTMIHDPQVVVFDEPTSGLDVITADHIIQLIRDCKTQGKTVIFSSHIMSEVDLLCDDLAIIHEGKLRFRGTMAEFRAGMGDATLTEAFIRTVHSDALPA